MTDEDDVIQQIEDEANKYLSHRRSQKNTIPRTIASYMKTIRENHSLRSRDEKPDSLKLYRILLGRISNANRIVANNKKLGAPVTATIVDLNDFWAQAKEEYIKTLPSYRP